MIDIVAGAVRDLRECAHGERAGALELRRDGREQRAARRQLAEIGQVLHDVDAGGEKHGVSRPLAR